MIQTLCQLIYDSAAADSHVGARSTMSVDRSLVFRTADLAIDLVIQGGGGDLRVIHGQVVADESGAPVAGARVHLASGGEGVVTDAHGQFALSTTSPDDQQLLCIDTSGKRVICSVPAVEVAETR